MEERHTEDEYIPLLLVMPELIEEDEEPLPGSFERGHDVWNQALELYDADRYEDAAAAFLTAAETMRQEEAPTYAESLATARASCYHNAWECYQGAALAQEGRRQLLAIAERDAACASDIEELLEDEGGEAL